LIRIALVVAALVVAVAPLPRAAIERLYSNGAFPVLQRAATAASDVVPFALLDLFALGALVGWLAFLVRAVRSRPRGWRRAALRIIAGTASAFAALYLLFVLMWGLNYRRVPLAQKVPFDRRAITPAAARELARRAVTEANALHAPAHAELDRRAAADGERSLAIGFARAQRIIGVPQPARPARPKRSLLDVYFRAAGVEGMIDPFFLETLTVSGLLPFEKPFVVAHEWSHLAGFADEGEANFIGWLACLNSSDAARYSGWLFLYREVVSTLPAPERAEISQRLAEGPRADLRAIADRIRRQVRPVVSNAGWQVYDRYLKANRVEAGAESYAQVVQLVLGTRGAGYF
jgi:hypothetical protein